MAETRRAQLGTREVSIQVLRVDEKKMSLQLFRQIPVVNWLDRDGQPRTDLNHWGRVHYRIPKEGSEWLLAELDGTLYRCCIDPPDDLEWLVKFEEKQYETGGSIARLEGPKKIAEVKARQAKVVEVRTLMMFHLSHLPQLFIA